MKIKHLLVSLSALFLLSACSPEIGSEEWCQNLKEKPKGEWTLDETKDYTKHCIL